MGGGPDPPASSCQTVRDQKSSESILLNGDSGRQLEETEQMSRRAAKEYVRLPRDEGVVTRGSLSDHEAIEDPAVDKSSGIDRNGAWYSCLLHQPCKLKKAEDLLKSKVQVGEEFVRVKYGDEIVGWDFLCLDDKARFALERYEAIRDLRPGRALAKSSHDDPLNAIKALGRAEQCCDGRGGHVECTEESLRAKMEHVNRVLGLTAANEKIEKWYPALDEVIREGLEWYWMQQPDRGRMKAFCGVDAVRTAALKDLQLYEAEAVDDSVSIKVR